MQNAIAIPMPGTTFRFPSLNLALVLATLMTRAKITITRIYQEATVDPNASETPAPPADPVVVGSEPTMTEDDLRAAEDAAALEVDANAAKNADGGETIIEADANQSGAQANNPGTETVGDALKEEVVPGVTLGDVAAAITTTGGEGNGQVTEMPPNDADIVVEVVPGSAAPAAVEETTPVTEPAAESTAIPETTAVAPEPAEVKAETETEQVMHPVTPAAPEFVPESAIPADAAPKDEVLTAEQINQGMATLSMEAKKWFDRLLAASRLNALALEMATNTINEQADEIKQMDSELEVANRQLTTAMNEVASRTAEIARLNEVNAGLDERIGRQFKTIEKGDAEIGRLNAEIKRLNDELAHANTALRSVEDEQTGLLDTIQGLRDQLDGQESVQLLADAAVDFVKAAQTLVAEVEKASGANAKPLLAAAASAPVPTTKQS